MNQVAINPLTGACFVLSAAMFLLLQKKKYQGFGYSSIVGIDMVQYDTIEQAGYPG